MKFHRYCLLRNTPCVSWRVIKRQEMTMGYVVLALLAAILLAQPCQGLIVSQKSKTETE